MGTAQEALSLFRNRAQGVPPKKEGPAQAGPRSELF